MSIMNTISKPSRKPPIITICGDAGTGKTSLAATFPKTIFIRGEDGLQGVADKENLAAFPVLENSSELFAQLNGLLNEEHQYRTLVIDSVSALERLFTEEIVKNDKNNPKSINQAMGGYGNGPLAVAGMHNRVRSICRLLNTSKNMCIIFIAHADTEQIEPPDADPYTRYSLRLGKKSHSFYTDEVDLIGFLKLNTFLDEKGRAISDGSRSLVCHATAANISKNRYGITEPLQVEFGVNPLKHFFNKKVGE